MAYIRIIFPFFGLLCRTAEFSMLALINLVHRSGNFIIFLGHIWKNAASLKIKKMLDWKLTVVDNGPTRRFDFSLNVGTAVCRWLEKKRKRTSVSSRLELPRSVVLTINLILGPKIWFVDA